MQLLTRGTGLYTDHYELTMAQGYFKFQRHEKPAIFDYFFRKNPFKGGFTLFAGLDSFLDMLESFHFENKDINYLKNVGFADDFLDYLKNFRFSGSIYSFSEGDLVFPKAPVVRVEAPILEAQIIETLLLNILNFETLIATRAARMKIAAGGRNLIDFGMRRAQGLGAIHATRAAVIGGFTATSNVLSADLFGLTSTGTMAHSWVQSYEDEYQAFSEFAAAFPENCILLIDTYNTLNSGVPNSIKVAREMEQRGHKLMGVRLDSGDLAYLSKKTRKQLDDAGFNYVKIIVSNQMDEHIMASLIQQGASIDGFGVGTRLVTGKPDAALDGVYKLASFDGTPRLKLSENSDKLTLPGRKSVIRYFNKENKAYADVVALEGEMPQEMIYPGQTEIKNQKISCMKAEPKLEKVWENGRRLFKKRNVKEIQEYGTEKLLHLPNEHKRFENPHVYKVGISPELLKLRNELIEKHM